MTSFNLLRMKPGDSLLENENGRRSVARLIASAQSLSRVTADFLGPFQIAQTEFTIPRFTFRASNSSDPIRIGIFGSIHGDEPAGAVASISFLEFISGNPETAESFELLVYPVCNPSGFEDNTRHSRNGRDLNREFWKNSSETEVRLLEHELRTKQFSGIVQLHADDTSDGLYGFVRGHTLTEHLLRPALTEAGKILPRNVNAQIDGFAARDSIIYEHYEGILAAPSEMHPLPFEIVLETPQLAPMDLQVNALTTALRTILAEYRRLISFAQNI